jgi:O-antigen/teichoic acid export membrane protein
MMGVLSLKNMAYAWTPSAVHPFLKRLESSQTGSRLARGAFWSMAGAIISRGLMMAAWIVVARVLGKSVYGEFGIIRSTVDMFAVFAGFGLSLTATKYIAEFRLSDPARAGRILSLSGMFAALSGGAIAIGLYFFSPWLAQKTLNAPHLADAIRIGGLMLLANSLNGAQTGALAGFEAFRAIAVVNSVCGLLAFPLFWFCSHRWGLYGLLWAYTGNLWLIWLLSHIALRAAAAADHVPFTWNNCWREWPILWHFSLPAVLSGLMVSPVKWTGNAWLVHQSEGYAAMGLFSAVLIFQGALLFVSSWLSRPLLSMLANKGDNVSDKLAKLNILISWCLGIMVAVPFLCFPEIGEWLFGREYSGAQFRMALSLTLLYTCVVMYKEGLARVLAVRNLMWWGFLSNAVWGGILLVSAYYLVPFGAPGLAASYLLAYVINTLVIMPLYVKRNLVPANTLFSKETFIIWTTLAGLTGMVVLDLALLSRVLIFASSIVILTISIRNIACFSQRHIS